MNPLVSIIILNYNGADLLPNCLGSLLRVTYSPIEIIVVENGSKDNSLAVLAEFPTVRTVKTLINLGSSGGYNLGFEHSRGEFILMMNNDMIANPDFVSVLSRYLVENAKVGIVQGKMVLPRSGDRLEVCGSFFTRFGLLYHYGYYKPDGPKYEKNYPIFSAKGACMMFRRQVVADVGGYYFNPDFFCYYEETDLCHRAWLAGYETHFVASPAIEHLAGVTIAREEPSGFALHYYFRNMIFSLLTTLGPLSIIRIMPLYFAMFFASMLLAGFTGRWPTAKGHWKALTYNVTNCRQIFLQRRRIRSFRKVADAEIFERILRNPRIDYFIKSFQGKLDKYLD